LGTARLGSAFRRGDNDGALFVAVFLEFREGKIIRLAELADCFRPGVHGTGKIGGSSSRVMLRVAHLWYQFRIVFGEVKSVHYLGVWGQRFRCDHL